MSRVAEIEEIVALQSESEKGFLSSQDKGETNDRYHRVVAGMLASEAEAMKELMQDVPIGRLGRLEEVAAAVLWLCSPGASFVIGHARVVDGGYTIR